MINESHEIAVSKGWHEGDEMGPDGTPSPRQRLAWIALALTEWVEDCDDCGNGLIWSYRADSKPIGRISELTDIIIRIEDTLGSCGEPLDGPTTIPPGKSIPLKADPIVYCLGQAAECCRTGNHAHFAAWLRVAIIEAQELIMGIRLLSENKYPTATRAHDEKCAYNRTREHRHGGKLA